MQARDEERAEETAAAIEAAVAAQLQAACGLAVEEARFAWGKEEEARFAAIAVSMASDKERFADDLQQAVSATEQARLGGPHARRALSGPSRALCR